MYNINNVLLLLLHLWIMMQNVSCASKPNIVMIVADDMGFNDVSFHGCPQIPTPNLDYLANNGIILNKYYALPNCTPTRSSIMTGRYPIHTGMQSGTIYAASPWSLGLEEKILPQYLKELGYKTHAIGKWHIGFYAKEFTPAQRGFDTFYGFYGGQADYWDHSLKSNGFFGLDLHKDTPDSSETVWTQWGNYSSNMYAMEAIDRIKNHDQKDPLFVYLAYQAVHSANLVEDPLQAPEAWINKFNHIKHIGRRKYAAIMAYMDYSIGKVYKALEASGMLDNTIFIFTSDNGGPANGLDMNWATNYPLRGAKTTVYEGGVRVAGFIHSKLLKTPRVSDDMMHVSDWLPTLLAAAGANVTNIMTSLDGMNLWETLKDQVPSPRTEILINIDEQLYHNAALISGDWKLVNQSRFYDGWYPPPGMSNINNNSKGWRSDLDDAQIKCGPIPKKVPHCGGKGYKPCLFNITNDPCEHVDVSETYPEVYKNMLKKLEDYRKKMVRPRRDTSTDPEANPKKHNGAWVPWRKVTSEFNINNDVNKIEKGDYVTY